MSEEMKKALLAGATALRGDAEDLEIALNETPDATALQRFAAKHEIKRLRKFAEILTTAATAAA